MDEMAAWASPGCIGLWMSFGRSWPIFAALHFRRDISSVGALPFMKRGPQAEVATLRDEWRLVVRAHRSLDAIAAPGSAWPPASSASPQSVTHKPHGSRWNRGSPVREVCTVPPAITPDTRFLTVTALAAGRDYANFLLVWDFNGKPRK